MQVELDIPASAQVRVYVLGPLELWKKDASGAWKQVPKSQWKNNRPARSVFKRLLVQPGRRLTRGTIEDDIWAEAENLEAVPKQVYNAISLIRGIIGKSLVTCWEATYALADQSLIWTDLDACSALLKEAENRGAGSLQAIPLLEQAVALLDRGALLEGEEDRWCYAFRKWAEDMARQARMSLAASYEMRGKLWQAGEQYRTMILTDPSDEAALQSWLEMLARHGKRQEVLKCYQEMRAFVEEQGFPLSSTIEQSVTFMMEQSNRLSLTLAQPLKEITQTTELYSNSPLVQGTFSHIQGILMPEQEVENSMDLFRRKFLHDTGAFELYQQGLKNWKQEPRMQGLAALFQELGGEEKHV